MVGAIFPVHARLRVPGFPERVAHVRSPLWKTRI
jgi:hypothetical protein